MATKLSNAKLVYYLIRHHRPPLTPQELHLAMILALKYRNEETASCTPTHRTLARDLGLKHHEYVGRLARSLKQKEVLIYVKTVDPQDPTKPRQPLQYFFLYDLDELSEMSQEPDSKLTAQVLDDLNCAKVKLDQKPIYGTSCP